MKTPIKLSDDAVNALTSMILSRASKKTINTFLGEDKYAKYKDDPVGFCEDILGETLTDDIRVMMESVRDNQITIAVSANATGKSMPLSCRVQTLGGSRAIGDIVPGDTVIGGDGKPVMVKAVYPQGPQPTYEIFFNDDTSVFASEDHLWSVRSSSDQYRNVPYKIYTTDQLRGVVHRRLHIPMCGQVEYKKQLLSIDPYVMGVLLGDGHLGNKDCSVTLTSGDEWIFDEVRSRVKDVEVKDYKSKDRTPRVGFTTQPGKENPFRDAMRLYGLIGCTSADKFIPADYMISSVTDRKALLAGLLDSDGYIDSRHSMSYTTVSSVLARQVQQLVWSLGGTAKIRDKVPFYLKNGTKVYGKKAYNLYIKVPFCPFRLPRKVERWVPECDLQKQAQRIIKAIKYVGMMDSQCISVDNSDGLYLTENFIVTHNTHGAARVAVWFYLCHPKVKVFTAAAPPYDNLKNLLWGEIGSVVRAHPELFMDSIQTTLDIRRGPEDYLIGVTIPSTSEDKEARFSGKHRPFMLFVLDEGDAIPDEVHSGIESCMSGGHTRLLIMFNPRKSSGAVYRMIRDADRGTGEANIVYLSAFTHPNVLTGEDKIPGAVTREKTVKRINMWCRPLRSGDEESERSVFTLPDFLEGAVAERKQGQYFPPLKPGKYKILNSCFSYMVLGQYPAHGTDQLISEEWISAARSRYDIYVAQYGETPPGGATGVMGLDVAEMGDDSNVAVGRYGGYLTPFTSWSGVNTVETGDRAVVWYQAHKGITRANVDGTGVGSGVASYMQLTTGIVATSIKVAKRATTSTDIGDFRITRDELLWRVREWLRTDPGAMLPPNEDLDEELKALTYNTDSGKVEVLKTSEIKKILGRSPDHLMSLAMTFANQDGFFEGCDFQAFPD